MLNDGPLRARLLHIANQHGIALVHPSVAHALETATELLLTRLLQGMMHSARLRSRHAKDVPGMVKDNNRNWEREVRHTLTACWQGTAVIICRTQGVRCSVESRHSPLGRAAATASTIPCPRCRRASQLRVSVTQMVCRSRSRRRLRRKRKHARGTSSSSSSTSSPSRNIKIGARRRFCRIGQVEQHADLACAVMTRKACSKL